jgi:hypothetical protein
MAVRAIALAIVLAIVLAFAAGAAHAQAPSDVLRDGNTAATAGDWGRVSQLVDPLMRYQLSSTDLAEANRLAGLAAYFQQRPADAEAHFLAYLRIDLDGHLDPALYPPEAITFFDDVRARHGAELRARRPRPKRSFALNLIPPMGQFQNGQRTKGYVLTGLLGALAIGNVTSYFLLRSWCTRVSGDSGSSITCDNNNSDHYRGAQTARVINMATGIGLILTYAYGVYDGVEGYRRRTREQSVQPFATPMTNGGVVGIAGSF